MKARTGIIHYTIIVILVLAAVVYAHFKAIDASEQAVAKHKQEDLDYWKGKLLPMYESSGLRYEPNPKTRDELFGPLFSLMAPLK